MPSKRIYAMRSASLRDSGYLWMPGGSDDDMILSTTRYSNWKVEYFGIVRFNLTSIPPNISSVTLSLTARLANEITPPPVEKQPAMIAMPISDSKDWVSGDMSTYFNPSSKVGTPTGFTVNSKTEPYPRGTSDFTANFNLMVNNGYKNIFVQGNAQDIIIYVGGGVNGSPYLDIFYTLPTPAIPSYLNVSSESVDAGKTVTLTWPATASTTSYELQRSVNGGTFATIYSGSSRTYIDTTDKTQKTIQYRVRGKYDFESNISYGNYKLSPVVSVISFPSLGIKIDGVLKVSENGWCKVDGVLKEIDKIWVKADGALKEV